MEAFSHSNGTFSREESGGLSIGNEEQDAASNPMDGGDDKSEHAVKEGNYEEN